MELHNGSLRMAPCTWMKIQFSVHPANLVPRRLLKHRNPLFHRHVPEILSTLFLVGVISAAPRAPLTTAPGAIPASPVVPIRPLHVPFAVVAVAIVIVVASGSTQTVVRVRVGVRVPDVRGVMNALPVVGIAVRTGVFEGGFLIRIGGIIVVGWRE